MLLGLGLFCIAFFSYLFGLVIGNGIGFKTGYKRAEKDMISIVQNERKEIAKQTERGAN